MKFFTRCKILYRVFMFLEYILGILLALQILEARWIPYRDFVFYVECGIFLFLLVCLIILKCIIKDAEEDLAAIMKWKEESETKSEPRIF